MREYILMHSFNIYDDTTGHFFFINRSRYYTMYKLHGLIGIFATLEKTEMKPLHKFETFDP